MPRGGLAKGWPTKMLGADELCIRLLSRPAGDKASTHALNVALVSMLMGRSFGLAGRLLDLGAGALMHDVGKLDLPTACACTARINFSAAEQGSTRRTRRLRHRAGTQDESRLTQGAHAGGRAAPRACRRLAAFRSSAAPIACAPLARVVALVNRYDNLCSPGTSSRTR